MSNDSGWNMRADILRRDAERKLLEALRLHGWTAEVERIERAGEYAVISAERHGLRRRVALLYSSATDNEIYRRLETEVDLTLFNGEPYQLDQFARGLSRPVFSADDFQLQLIEWNRASAPGKLVGTTNSPDQLTEPVPCQQRVRRLLSETPIDAVWSRLSRLQSAKLARKAVAERAAMEDFELAEAVAASKGDGVAYAIRNATDYFALKDVRNVSQRVLNLYYGCLSFVLAEMLAAPEGPAELSRVEDITKQGHGFWNLDGDGEGFGAFTVGPAQSGLFPAWMKSMRLGPLAALEKKPRRPTELSSVAAGSWATMEQLFARVPEVGDLFEDVFQGPPAWVSPVPDAEANMPSGFFGSGERPKTTYVLLIDDSGRMTLENIAALPGPIREISAVASGTRARHFRAAIDHPNSENLLGALNLHHSPFERTALIMPMFGCVDQYRAICVSILYGLSIVVRYRPSLWRRIQEGDLDHMRALIEAFLVAVERILPEQFLESVTGEKVSIHQPGSFFS